jgi:hypothetical protein
VPYFLLLYTLVLVLVLLLVTFVLSEFVLGFTEIFLCPLSVVYTKIVPLPEAYQQLMSVEAWICLKA